MITSLGISQIFVLDQDQALDFYVGKLGMELVDDVDFGVMRWLTIRVPGEDRQVLLERPDPPRYDPVTTESVREMVTKGAAGGHLFFYTDDAYGTHADLQAKGVELPEEPTEQSYGIDFGFRDPFGTTSASPSATPPPADHPTGSPDRQNTPFQVTLRGTYIDSVAPPVAARWPRSRTVRASDVTTTPSTLALRLGLAPAARAVGC